MEFRAAARMRFDDGLVAATQDRRTATIYFWGYAAEMTLKATYFNAIGFHDRQTITMSDLRQAIVFGQSVSVSWPTAGRLHCVRAWAETLVLRRGSSPGIPYASPGTGTRVADQGRRLEGLKDPGAKPNVITRTTLISMRSGASGIRRSGCWSTRTFCERDEMPRIKRPFATRFTPKSSEITDRLVTEFKSTRESGQPLIKEAEFDGGRLRVIVLWDVWEKLSHEDRSKRILNAYLIAEGREVADRITLATGLTFPEAYVSGMLPFRVIPALRMGDPVTAEQSRDAMIA